MHQLTGHAAGFLYSDTAHANGNVSYIQIYDQSTAPGGKVRFKSILAHIESRLHRSPVFRAKLLRVPFELDLPYWVDDEHFNLEHHVRHIALPQPGDWRQFCIQASRIHARALDLNRPLWEIYVVEGLDSLDDLPAGSFALLTKIHRAAVDTARHAEIVQVLHDTARRPRRGAPPQPWFAQEPPSPLALSAHAAVNSMLAPWRLMGPLARLAPAALAFASDLARPPEALVATRFNAVVSMHRVFDTRRFMVGEFERIRALVPGATLNDAVLAVCAGGLRRYLAAHGELPEQDLAATAQAEPAPSTEPAAPETEQAWLRIGLGTHLADPLQRLAWIQTQTARPIDRAARRALPGLPGLPGVASASCTVSHIPGPTQPLYLSGARLSYFSAILPIADGMGLVFAVTRYDGRIVISPTSCRELMPDPQAFAQYLRDSFQEYLALARPAAKRGGAKRANGSAKAALRPAKPRASASGKRAPARPRARTAASAPRAAPAGRQRSTAPRR
jgi:diacylglycerol O-acyltransferase / wax synthase